MNTTNKKTGVLLINLGTPDSPKVSDVRSYLTQFLNDPRVIDLPTIKRTLLVNGIIVPFRAKGSSKEYQKLWTENGSPLLYYSVQTKEKLQEALGDEVTVELAMRYKNPSIPDVLEKMRKENYDKIIVLPLFPQYASATNGSAIEEVFRVISKWWVIPELDFVGQFWDHPLYIEAFAEIGNKFNIEEYDHVIFSYHGLPTRQVDKVYDNGLCEDHDCELEITEENKFCYKATSYATTRAIAENLNIPEDKYTVAFQSRLDKEWLEPFADKTVIEQAKKGAKKLLFFSPAFTADCLETIVEIGEGYQELFEEHGGEKVQLVPSLNDHPKWIECLKDIVKKRI
ncbi:ferrochelatase [Marinigracilibium pacificum]|uniref:Ferrochelatase n=1 Tax=Marinigracilibium pacificum TaxID=2729599 RepID=A0A848IY98_9BACT|nr:ferrochelatase [Marinigracilibium pacificum]NMM46959.1 ferrochelatase [Marinigracilibium pacificum]